MELNYHFDTETFRAAWEEWKTYRNKTIKKPIRDEQRALNALYKKSRQDEATALCMMEFSIDNDYQGLFYRKPDVNIQSLPQSKVSQNLNNSQQADNLIDQMYGQ